jgi:hypothetical protein
MGKFNMIVHGGSHDFDVMVKTVGVNCPPPFGQFMVDCQTGSPGPGRAERILSWENRGDSVSNLSYTPFSGLD